MSIPLAAAQELFEICNLEEDQFKIATLNYIIIGMYFAGIIQTEKQEILRRIYRTLFNAKGLTVELLANCYQTNRLNELIHKKFKFKPSIIYQRFCSEIGYVRPLCSEPVDNAQCLEILDDDHCPTCNKKGFYTENRNISKRCNECNNIMCISCYGECNTCFKCY